MFTRREERLTAEPEPATGEVRLAELAEELGRLRKTVLRQGHAQELFQERVEEAVGRLAAAARPAASATPAPALPSEAQVRALLELDRAVGHLLRLAAGGANAEGPAAGAPDEDAPGSLREGLSLLQVRVRNLGHSLGLEPIPALGRPFDDRRHRAEAVVERAGLPDRAVVEEILPGYTLGERVVRPARVVVNRRGGELP